MTLRFAISAPHFFGAGDTGAAFNRVFRDIDTQTGQVGKPQAVRCFIQLDHFAVGKVVELLAQFGGGGLRVNRIHDVQKKGLAGGMRAGFIKGVDDVPTHPLAALFGNQFLANHFFTLSIL